MMRFLALLCLVVSAYTTDAFSQGGWVVRHAPAAAGVDLNGVYAIDDSIAIAVGNSGTIIRTTDAGWTWSKQLSPTTQNLHDVVFQPLPMTTTFRGVGIAIGDSGTILQSIDSGKTWIARAGVTTLDLRSAAVHDAYQFAISGDSGRIFYSSNSGVTWVVDTLLLKKPQRIPTINAIAFINNERIIVVGDSGKAFERDYGLELPGKELTTGTSVDLHVLTAPLPGYAQVAALSESGTIQWTDDNADTWTHSSFGTVLDPIAAAWPENNAGFIVGNNGQVLASTDYLKTWVKQTSGTDQNLHAVSFANNMHGFAVGAAGTIITTENGGEQPAPPQGWKESIPRPQRFTLRAIQAITASVATAVGHNGTILRSMDAGKSWTSQVSNATADLLGVEFSDISNGLVVGMGGVVLRTTNGGATWTSVESGTTKDLHSVSFSDTQIVVAVGQTGTVIRSTDAGLTWAATAKGLSLPRDINSIDFAGGGIAVAVGVDGQIIRTNDGGITWTKNPDSHGSTNFTCVSFGQPYDNLLLGQYGIATSDNEGPFRTTNGGKDWRSSGCFGCGDFGVSMIDIDNGTAVGWDGFITTTRDAGLEWNTVAHHFDGSVLYAVSNYGWETSIAVGEGGRILYKSTSLTAVAESTAQLPSSLSIYPNPASSLTTIEVRGVKSGPLRIDLVNPLGNTLCTLLDDDSGSDTFLRSYDLSFLPTGTYYCRAVQSTHVISQLLTIVR